MGLPVEHRKHLGSDRVLPAAEDRCDHMTTLDHPGSRKARSSSAVSAATLKDVSFIGSIHEEKKSSL